MYCILIEFTQVENPGGKVMGFFPKIMGKGFEMGKIPKGGLLLLCFIVVLFQVNSESSLNIKS